MIPLLELASHQTYAERRYEAGMRSWRGAAARLFFPIFGLPLLAAIAWGAHTRQWSTFFAGMLVGVIGMGWIMLRDEPPTYLQSWRAGAEGERKTHDALLSLGWHLFEDIDHGSGNYDHVIVGPPGVFLVETKNPTGTVRMRDGEPWLERRHDPEAKTRLTAVGKRARRDSATICEEIERRCGEREWVNPVVAFWSDFPDGVFESPQTAYLHGSKLADWLRARPERLTPQRVAAIAGALAGLKTETDVRARQRAGNAS